MGGDVAPAGGPRPSQPAEGRVVLPVYIFVVFLQVDGRRRSTGRRSETQPAS